LNKASNIKIDEILHENRVVRSGSGHLLGDLCGRQAELQKVGQELPDERQQGMQLRQGLRLRASKLSVFGSGYVATAAARILLAYFMSQQHWS
jgi:hypothetical protein